MDNVIKRETKIGNEIKDFKVELVYFDIHARGELTRLCYYVTNREDEYIDTRLPLFMESEANAKVVREIHRPKSPFEFFPYLNVTQTVNGYVANE